MTFLPHTSTSKSLHRLRFTRVASARLSHHNQHTGTNEHEYSRVMHYCAIRPAEQCGAHTIASQYTKKLVYMGRKRVCMMNLVIVRKNYSIFHNRTGTVFETKTCDSRRKKVSSRQFQQRLQWVHGSILYRQNSWCMSHVLARTRMNAVSMHIRMYSKYY
jgi:hypothetical protein